MKCLRVPFYTHKCSATLYGAPWAAVIYLYKGRKHWKSRIFGSFDAETGHTTGGELNRGICLLLDTLEPIEAQERLELLQKDCADLAERVTRWHVKKGED